MKKLFITLGFLLFLNSCQSIKITDVATINQKRFPVISADEYNKNKKRAHLIIAWEQNQLNASVRLQTTKRGKDSRLMAGGIPKFLGEKTIKNDIVMFLLHKELLDHKYCRNVFHHIENMERRFYIVYFTKAKTAAK